MVLKEFSAVIQATVFQMKIPLIIYLFVNYLVGFLFLEMVI